MLTIDVQGRRVDLGRGIAGCPDAQAASQVSSLLELGTSVFWRPTGPESQPGEQKQDPETEAESPPTVLVADDDDDIRSAIVEALQEEGDWNVVEAKNGAEALALAISMKPSAMVLDHGMPGLTGSDVVLRLRAHETPPPIIFISAAENVRHLASELGLSCFLGKPFSLDQLTSLVTKALNGNC